MNIRFAHRMVLFVAISISLLVAVIVFPASAETIAPIESQIQSTHQGGILRIDALDLTKDHFSAIPMKRINDPDAPPTQFLLSDMPEYFRTGDGIALQERVKPGIIRLYTYHVPTPDDPIKKITATIENRGDKPMNFKFTRYAFPKPGGYYQVVAANAMRDFLSFNNPYPKTRTLAPGKRMILDPNMDRVQTKKDMLVHGWYEFEIDQPAEVAVFQTDIKDDSKTIVDRLPKLPRSLKGWSHSGSGRGTFLDSNFLSTPADEDYVYDTAEGIKRIIVADGKTDPWITGYDQIQRTEGQNRGHYGTIYKIRIKWKSSDKRNLALITYSHHMKSKWCGNVGLALGISKGEFPAGVIMAPTQKDRLTFKRYPEAVLIQRFKPDPEKEVQEFEILFTPPGASCLPMPFALIPYDTE
ncbi:hypothetical protein [Poriferisphaera sp. WC338]|uniref:hypothetical protein n=1 Tax=Poriferisphaera sp. WC338 TaxID=3425129 RepID=UPI003D815EF2